MKCVRWSGPSAQQPIKIEKFFPELLTQWKRDAVHNKHRDNFPKRISRLRSCASRRTRSECALFPKSGTRARSKESRARKPFLRVNCKMPKGDKTKKVSGVDLSMKNFLHVGDPEDTSTWLLPVYIPGDLNKTKNLLCNHIERFHQMKSIPPAEKRRLWERLVGACRAHGIHLNRDKVVRLTPEEIAVMHGEIAAHRVMESLDMQWMPDD